MKNCIMECHKGFEHCSIGMMIWGEMPFSSKSTIKFQYVVFLELMIVGHESEGLFGLRPLNFLADLCGLPVI